jgi:hypothetical protein
MSGDIGEELIPRIPFEEFGLELRESLRPKVERLGYCGEIWQVGAHVPKSMYHFCELTEALKAEMDLKLVELVALTVAGIMGNTYERNQHEHLAERLGYPRTWIAQVTELGAEKGRFMTDAEVAVQKFVIEALDRSGHQSAGLFREMAQVVGPKNAMGVLLSVGRCVMHALLRNTFGLAPPVPSIFEVGKNA